MKRLFALRNKITNMLLPEYYDDKKEAKKKRDELGKDNYAVAPGPGHYKAGSKQ